VFLISSVHDFKYNGEVPADWENQCKVDFDKCKGPTNTVSVAQFGNFIEEYLKSCTEEMRNTHPPVEEFMSRYSTEDPNYLTYSDFQDFWRETYLVKLMFEKGD